ncbi:hypothetical protein ACE41H_17105 [Paenibacillus enshidis]|uniref:Uncharacterized protein n=1 Tax=Paenibacillus enshidis TaxID=1458439 RepID=A0ABV5AWB1_9BACL
MDYDLDKEETAISSKSVPLLVELVQRGVMSKPDALLQHFLEDAIRRHSDAALFHAPWNSAEDTLLEWCDDFRFLQLRLNAGWESRMVSHGRKADGLCLFSGGLRQEGKIANFLESYMSANNPEKRSLLSGRMISWLEHEYERWFEHMKGQPVTVPLVQESGVSPYKDYFLDQQLEAFMRAALKAMRNGWEPVPEIVIANPGEADAFRKLREWVDAVAEQTLWTYYRSVPYRIGALLSANQALPAAAAELAYYTDLLFIDYTQMLPNHAELDKIIKSVRRIRPTMEIWAIFSHMDEYTESAFQSGVSGLVCPPSEAAFFKLKAAQSALRQNQGGEEMRQIFG